MAFHPAANPGVSILAEARGGRGGGPELRLYSARVVDRRMSSW